MSLKEKGNEEFKNKNYKKALSYYTEAIKSLLKGYNYEDFCYGVKEFQGPSCREELSILYSNRGMAYLKLEQNHKAIADFYSSIFFIIHPQSISWDKIYDFTKKPLYEKIRKNLTLTMHAIGNHCDAIEQIHRCNDIHALNNLFLELIETVFVRVTKFPRFDENLMVKGSWKVLEEKFPDKYCRFASGVGVKNKIYIFGGTECSLMGMMEYTNRLLEYDIKKEKFHQIKHLSQEAPIGREGSTLCEYEGKLYLFGGNSLFKKDQHFWCFDLEKKTWSLPPNKAKYSAPNREGHSAVVYKDRLIVYGGQLDKGKEDYGDVDEYSFTKQEWKKISKYHNDASYGKFKLNSPDYPEPRYQHKAWVIQDEMWIFSGMCAIERAKKESDYLAFNYDDLWSFNLNTNKWKRYRVFPGNIPCPRSEYGVCVVRNTAYMFGGYSNTRMLIKEKKMSMDSSYLNETFEFSRVTTQNNEIVDLEQPKENQRCWRMVHYEKTVPFFKAGAIFVSCGNRIFLIGGYTYYIPGVVEQDDNFLVYELTIHEKRCDNCLKDTLKIETIDAGLCGKCQKTYYCSRQCQKEHWNYHKTFCK